MSEKKTEKAVEENVDEQLKRLMTDSFENPRPDDWLDKMRSVSKLGMLPPQTEFPIIILDSFDWLLLKSQLFEAGADAITPWAKEEGKRELLKELLAKDTTIFMNAGSELTTGVSYADPVMSWTAPEPGFLAFIPLRLKGGG